MTLEQAREIVANRRMLVFDEASLADIDLWQPKYRHLRNAIDAFGESLADLRSHQSVEERTTAAAEASNRYITEKRIQV